MRTAGSPLPVEQYSSKYGQNARYYKKKQNKAIKKTLTYDVQKRKRTTLLGLVF